MNRNIKILVIEDEGAIRNLISTALQTNGYKYEVCIKWFLCIIVIINSSV